MRFRPLVLCYHAICDGWNHPLAVDAGTLERQLRLLLRGGLAPAGAREILFNRGRSFHVTFDDGYRNVASAIPVLERLEIPATVFVCTGYARDGRRLVIPELADQDCGGDHLLTMTWDAVRELAERGVEIGSHSVSHPHLHQLTDVEVRRELADSREEIETELGRPCRFLAYPYGDEDARVQGGARAAGYVAAYTLRRSGRSANPLALPRADVYRGDRLVRFAAKASPAGRPAMAALTGVRRRVRRPRPSHPAGAPA